jgi:hypothetical protein
MKAFTVRSVADRSRSEPSGADLREGRANQAKSLPLHGFRFPFDIDPAKDLTWITTSSVIMATVV